MYKKAKYQNKVNNQTVSIYNSWNPTHDTRHFMAISRIGAEHVTITREHVYPTFEAAMEKISKIESWLTANKI